MGVVSLRYGWLCGGRDGGRGWCACLTMPEGLVVCQEMLEHFPSAR